ncbi:ABC transporter substrate-binding protein [Brachybacterium sp. DNPG3]
MLSRRRLLLSALATGGAGAGVLAACSRQPEVDLGTGEALQLRVWSDAAASAYRTSLDLFTEETGIEVEIETLAWEDYWSQLPLDVAAGSLPDVLWMNTAHLAQLVAAEQLLEVGEIVGDDTAQWEAVATDLYRRDDGLWGVPQVWERSVLLTNTSLLEASAIDPASLDLAFDPGADSDSLRELCRTVVADSEGLGIDEAGFDASAQAVHGFSAQADRSAVLGPFIAGAGGAWQDEEDAFVFASDDGIAAVQYLADLAAAHLAPDGASTVADSSLCQELFTGGRLALWQTGTYDLGTVITEVGDTFAWSVGEVIAGPEGTHPLVHAVAAVGITTKDDDRSTAIERLLVWLGSADGQRPLAEARLGIPAHRDLHQTWADAWKEAGADVSALADAPTDPARPESGVRSAEGTGAALPIIAGVFTGETDAATALPEAQTAASEAMGA